MVVVPKPTRAVLDLKPLNQNVVHPMPKVDVKLAQLNGAKVFSKLDMNSGFWQVPLAKESRLLTTFITPYGQFCFNKLPFGIINAPEHFQHCMSEILDGLLGIVGHVDDVRRSTIVVLMFYKGSKQLDSHLTEVNVNFHVIELYYVVMS